MGLPALAQGLSAAPQQLACTLPLTLTLPLVTTPVTQLLHMDCREQALAGPSFECHHTRTLLVAVVILLAEQLLAAVIQLVAGLIR